MGGVLSGLVWLVSGGSYGGLARWVIIWVIFAGVGEVGMIVMIIY